MTLQGRMLPARYPKVYVEPIPHTERVNWGHWDSKYTRQNIFLCDKTFSCVVCVSRRTSPCWAATQRMFEFFDAISVSREDAEWMILPYYQPCERNATMFLNAERQEVEKGEHGKRSIWVLVHDWGKCNCFQWSTADLRKRGLDTNKLASPMSNFFVTNGDSNTNCYWQRTDIVIPPE